MIEVKVYTEIKRQFTTYMETHGLRKTLERYTILEHVCAFPAHFDIESLHEALESDNFHVSKATLYNTLEVLLDARIIVRHQISTKAVQYELRSFAETHQHLICTKCGEIREIRNQFMKTNMKNFKVPRFTPEFFCLYIYGICSKCKFRMQHNGKK